MLVIPLGLKSRREGGTMYVRQSDGRPRLSVLTAIKVVQRFIALISVVAKWSMSFAPCGKPLGTLTDRIRGSGFFA